MEGHRYRPRTGPVDAIETGKLKMCNSAYDQELRNKLAVKLTWYAGAEAYFNLV